MSVVIEFDRIPEIAAAMAGKAAEAVAVTAHEIEAEAKGLAPVGETGNLRASIQASPEDALTWVIAVGVAYGIYQEFGTYKMPAHPFMLPAFTRAAPRLIAELASLIV
jgi:HK97 gp10 family phage protein